MVIPIGAIKHDVTDFGPRPKNFDLSSAAAPAFSPLPTFFMLRGAVGGMRTHKKMTP
jgi:hypothetical protein